MGRYDALITVVGLATLTIPNIPARGQDRYRELSNILAARYPVVKNQSRAYLNKEFLHDPAIRHPLGPAAFATSNLPDTVRGLPIQQDIILLQLKPAASAEQTDVLLRKYDLSVASGVRESAY